MRIQIIIYTLLIGLLAGASTPVRAEQVATEAIVCCTSLTEDGLCKLFVGEQSCKNGSELVCHAQL